MTKKKLSNHLDQYRPLRMESLEERQLLSVSSAELQNIRDSYDDFNIAADVNIIEIKAEYLTTSALQSAVNSAIQTQADDLLVLRTTNQNHELLFSKALDEIVINFDTNTSGRLTVVACGETPLTINAQSCSRIFTIKSGTVQLGNFILTGGNALTDLNGVSSTAGLGGAIASAGNLILSNISVINNQADSGVFDNRNTGFNSKGGGIYNSGSLLITDSLISNNIAKSGKVNSNDLAAYGAGGGIFNDTNATLTLKNTTVNNNTAENGIITVQPQACSEDEPAVAIKVELLGSGGGIYNFGATMISTNSVIANNSAWFGGGISSLYNINSSSVTLSESRVNGNTALDSGGGIYTAPRCSAAINRSFIQNNTAGINGGGITNRGDLSLINSVLSGNNAGTDGGGLYSSGTFNSAIPVYLVNIACSTITGNSSGTVKEGSGGGICFCGIQSENSFAVLDISNSIIVHNQVIKPDNLTSDVNLYKIGTCTGSFSLTSFSDWSNHNAVNYDYDESISLFVKNYNFTTKTEGDYHLVYGRHSQAIDAGNNTIAESFGLNSYSLDIANNTRFQNDTIDLGAYEFQISSFDPAFPSQLFVQQGSSFNLRCEGKDRNGYSFTKYYVDLNGDGVFDKEGSNLWISWNELSYTSDDSGYFWLAVENSLGQRSDTRNINVNITQVLPSIQTQQITFYDNQILILYLNVYYYDRLVQNWTVNWGDGTDPTQYNCLSSSLLSAHYYRQQEISKTYNITLSLIDSNGNGGNNTYYITSNNVPGTKTSLQTNNNSEENTQIYSSITENRDDVENAVSCSPHYEAECSASIPQDINLTCFEITDNNSSLYSFLSEDDRTNLNMNQLTSENESESAYFAADCFLTDHSCAPTSSDTLQNNVIHDGFYSDLNTDNVHKYYIYREADKPESILPEVADKLVNGYGVGPRLGIYHSDSDGTLVSDHTTTVWGYTVNAIYETTDPEYYTSLKISDSDNDKYSERSLPNNLGLTEIKGNPDFQKYQVLNFGSDSRYVRIDEFVTLFPKIELESLLSDFSNSESADNINELWAAFPGEQKNEWSLQNQYGQPRSGKTDSAILTAALDSLYNEELDL